MSIVGNIYVASELRELLIFIDSRKGTISDSELLVELINKIEETIKTADAGWI